MSHSLTWGAALSPVGRDAGSAAQNHCVFFERSYFAPPHEERFGASARPAGSYSGVCLHRVVRLGDGGEGPRVLPSEAFAFA